MYVCIKLNLSSSTNGYKKLCSVCEIKLKIKLKNFSAKILAEILFASVFQHFWGTLKIVSKAVIWSSSVYDNLHDIIKVKVKL